MVGGRHTLLAAGYSGRRDGAQRRNRLWLLLGCAIVLGTLISLFAVRGTRILTLRQQLQSSLLIHDEAMIERLELENRLALKDDLAAIEDAVRERLGWMMPGEVRVIFVDRTNEPASEGE
ncbi:hypothetical protein KAJ02_06045 [Candidatus Bipolaricaulota bacterium]|nr:hypothetical protein [Candidatus Bipolaricaulota bacterium]